MYLFMDFLFLWAVCGWTGCRKTTSDTTCSLVIVGKSCSSTARMATYIHTYIHSCPWVAWKFGLCHQNSIPTSMNFTVLFRRGQRAIFKVGFLAVILCPPSLLLLLSTYFSSVTAPWPKIIWFSPRAYTRILVKKGRLTRYDNKIFFQRERSAAFITLGRAPCLHSSGNRPFCMLDRVWKSETKKVLSGAADKKRSEVE